ncbi:MAG: ABC transporter substrate-binding protein [Saprospiraceae bacterium]
MTLVRNLPQLLSGNNKLVFILFCWLFFTGCSRKTFVVDSPQIIKPEKKPNPDTTDIVSIDKKTKSLDTIQWNDVSEANPPIKTPETNVDVRDKNPTGTIGKFVKDQYNVRLLIPLNSVLYNETTLTTNRFVQFYAGVLMALEELEKKGSKLTLHVTDTGTPNFKIADEVKSIENNPPDLIIGPFEREDLKLIASEAQKREITVVSPWQTSTKITKENDFYIQMKPNLKEHFLKITEHVCKHYQQGEVIVITHNNQEGVSWYNFFNDAANKYSNQNSFLTHFAVSSDSLVSPNTAFVNLFKTKSPKAIILPYYSYNDEAKLYSVIRRLSADKGINEVVVYGMPLMIESERIDYEFYSSLNIRVAMSEFVYADDYNVRLFKRKFLDFFGELASVDAIKGYDVMMFIGQNMKQYGSKFQEAIVQEKQYFLQTQVELQKTISDDSKKNPGEFDFFENKHILIIEFKQNGFQILE